MDFLCLKDRIHILPSISIPFYLFSTDCMHVTSEEGDFVYRKHGRLMSKSPLGSKLIEVDPSDPTVCGVYIVTDPNKVVEVTVKYLDVSCEFGGLVGVSSANKIFKKI